MIELLCGILMCCLEPDQSYLTDQLNETTSNFTQLNETCIGACAWVGYDWSQRNGSKTTKKLTSTCDDSEPGTIPCRWRE